MFSPFNYEYIVFAVIRCQLFGRMNDRLIYALDIAYIALDLNHFRGGEGGYSSNGDYGFVTIKHLSQFRRFRVRYKFHWQNGWDIAREQRIVYYFANIRKAFNSSFFNWQLPFILHYFINDFENLPAFDRNKRRKRERKKMMLAKWLQNLWEKDKYLS